MSLKHFIFALTLLFLVLPACSEESKKSVASKMYTEIQKQFPDVPVIKLNDYKKIQSDAHTILVDVRSEEERKVSLIPGAITLLELKKTEPDASKQIVVYCTIGYRSAQAVQELRKLGYNAANLEGSLLAWLHDQGPLLDPQGNATQKVHVYGKLWDLAPEQYQTVW